MWRVRHIPKCTASTLITQESQLKLTGYDIRFLNLLKNVPVSLTADIPQEKKSDLVARESDVGLPVILSLAPTLLEWNHESVQSVPSLFILDLLASVNEKQPFSHCWLCQSVDFSAHDYCRVVR